MGKRYVPVTDREKDDYAGGREAFACGIPAGLCPWGWKQCGSPTQEEFEAKYRNRLNMWMQGWIDAKDKL